jgi:hypothetical protein
VDGRRDSILAVNGVGEFDESAESAVEAAVVERVAEGV